MRLAMESFPPRLLHLRQRHELTVRVQYRGAMITPDRLRISDAMLTDAMESAQCYPERLDWRHAPVVILQENCHWDHQNMHCVSGSGRHCPEDWHLYRVRETLGLFRRTQTLLQDLEASGARDRHLENLDLRHGRVSIVQHYSFD